MHKPTMRTVSRWMVLLLVVIIAAGTVVRNALVHSPQSSHLIAGTALDGRLAPDFTLRDQANRLVRLSGLRGHVIVVTFLDAACVNTCTVTAQCLDQTAQMLGVRSSKVDWLAVSLNAHNTAGDAQSFVDKHNVTVPLHVLLGTQDQLSAIWQAYAIHVSSLNSAGASSPGATVSYVIDTTGHERELLDQSYDPRAAAQDISGLLSDALALPTSTMTQRVFA